MPKPEYSSCRLRRERKIGSSSPSCSSCVRSMRVELRPIACDVPVELLTGVGRAPDRLAQRVVALVAYEGSHVNADLRVVRHAQTSGGEPQHLRDARAALQHDAQDDGFTSWGVVDHVAHPGQDRQPRGLPSRAPPAAQAVALLPGRSRPAGGPSRPVIPNGCLRGLALQRCGSTCDAPTARRPGPWSTSGCRTRTAGGSAGPADRTRLAPSPCRSCAAQRSAGAGRWR